MDALPDNHRSDKVVILAGLTLFWIITTLANTLIMPTDAAATLMFLITSIGWGVGILNWCLVDARERGGELGGGEKVIIVGFGILALIWYLFRSRGGRGGLKAVGWLLLFSVCSLAVNVVVSTLVLIVLELAGVRSTA